MLFDTLKVLKAAMSNTLSRRILQAGSDSCEGGKEKRIEHALAIFAGEDAPHAVSCGIYFAMISGLLRLGGAIFGVKTRKLQDYFREPVVRRGLASVLMGIGRYGVTTPQRLNAPFLVVWNYTNACNLRCKHCYQDAKRPAPDELTTREKLRVVDELADAGVVSIAFSGGEPLMGRDFYRVSHQVAKKGMYVALATNGVMITKDVAKRLKESGVEYAEISIDAADPSVHDDFRGVRGSFEKTIEAIKNCREAGIFTCIATTVTRMNLPEIPNLIRLAKDLKVNRFITFNFIPVGRGEDIVALDLSPDEREGLLKTLFSANEDGGLEILSTAPQFARVSLELSKGKVIAPTHFYAGQASWDLRVLAEFIGGCGAGRLYCALQPNGDVTPCVFMPGLITGNIRDQSFLDIWNGSEVMRRLRNRGLLKNNCGHCEYKHVCGGCRARAFGYFGDYLAPDPGCINNKEFYELIKCEEEAIPLPRSESMIMAPDKSS